MQTISAGYRSLSFLFTLNLDRMLFGAAIIAALWLGSLMGSF
ncbi:hypothetical protein [Loktanella sp. IMCC34160]|nr:hypothetical protein [Loktanella sp. IMCC34160]